MWVNQDQMFDQELSDDQKRLNERAARSLEKLADWCRDEEVAVDLLDTGLSRRDDDYYILAVEYDFR